MAESIVQPEHLTDLVSSNAQTESGKLDRWIRGDNMTEALRVLEVDGERKELFDIHIEHVTVLLLRRCLDAQACLEDRSQRHQGS